MRLGSHPAEILVEPIHQMSSFYGLRLDDGREVAIKLHPYESGRAKSCVAAQRAVADTGFPCARPLTPAEVPAIKQFRQRSGALEARKWAFASAENTDACPSRKARRRFSITMSLVVASGSMPAKCRLPGRRAFGWRTWNAPRSGALPATTWSAGCPRRSCASLPNVTTLQPSSRHQPRIWPYDASRGFVRASHACANASRARISSSSIASLP